MIEQPDLAGKRVFIVEDEMLVSMLLEDMLTDLGCRIVATASRLGDALDHARDTALDVAILDVNLNGEASYAVAEALAARNLPFVFATGYGKAGLASAYRHLPALEKPFRSDDVVRALSEALCGNGGAGAGG